MQFALLNNKRVTPAPKLVATCPGCRQTMIAKCGEQKIWHWAHKGKRSCDPWWEAETEWHRAWKNQFDKEHQEIIQYDETGEKHIADIKTKHGLVIEFQHSYIPPEERRQREKLYGNMLWVVDGTRLKRDIKRFTQNINDCLSSTDKANIHYIHGPEKCLPVNWLHCTVPVLFDFIGIHTRESTDFVRGSLWCLLPGLRNNQSVILRISRKKFLEIASTRPHFIGSQRKDQKVGAHRVINFSREHFFLMEHEMRRLQYSPPNKKSRTL